MACWTVGGKNRVNVHVVYMCVSDSKVMKHSPIFLAFLLELKVNLGVIDLVSGV